MNLTQTATFTKRAILLSIIVVILGIVVSVGYKIWYRYYLSTLPPIEEKADEKFGKLPQILLPKSVVKSSNFSYLLDTTTGGFPQMPKVIKVYFIPQAGVSLLAPAKSKDLAIRLGFNSEAQSLSEYSHQFSDGSGGSLTVELTTGNFNLLKRVATDSATLDSSLPDQVQIIAQFRDYLQSKNLLSAELKDGRSKVIYDNPDFSQAKGAIVSIWPQDFDEKPIVTSNFNQALIKASITIDTDEANKFKEVRYIYWPIDKTTYSTYPIINASDAFEDLKGGKGYISLEPNQPQVSITSVYLAYYQSEQYTPYLQPVYIFEGPNFAALVPAIHSN